jgi:hypothetical protein
MQLYPYGPGSYLTSQLQAEIAAVLPTIAGINGSGYDATVRLASLIQVLFPAALSIADKTTLDAKITAHVPAPMTPAETFDSVPPPVRVANALAILSAKNATTTPQQRAHAQTIVDDWVTTISTKVT